jgi:thymidine kinase
MQANTEMNNDNHSRNLVFSDGYLKIVTGCMFSGKTTYIIRECKKWQSIGKTVLMINYDLDRRYTNLDKIVTHDKLSVDCMMISELNNDLNAIVEKYDVVIINEGQFFKNLKKYVLPWCDDMKKIVVVSGLDGDFLRQKFGEILELIPDCDEQIKLKAYCAICRDGTDAIFTWKKIDNVGKNDSIVDIGVDKYIPLCRKHYNEEKRKLVYL